MHYGDEKQLKENVLQVVIYKHGVVIDEDEAHLYSDRDYMLSLDSIQKCQYVCPRTLRHFLEAYPYLLDERFKELPEEEHYLVTIRYTGYEETCFDVEVEKVTFSENEFYGLH